MSILCKFYNSAEYIKNGLVKQEQRYKCKSCKGNFVNSDKRQKYTQIRSLKSIVLGNI